MERLRGMTTTPAPPTTTTWLTLLGTSLARAFAPWLLLAPPRRSQTNGEVVR